MIRRTIPMGGKFFELLDIPKFAIPNVWELDPNPTSSALRDRLDGGGFMSYGSLWPKIPLLVRDGISEDAVRSHFSFYREEWKNKSLQEAFGLLGKVVGGRGSWYRDLSKPKYTLGVWFRPSIKGVWFHEGKSYAVLVNPRKGQPLSTLDIAFLAQGVYQLHCLDDPNDPTPLIIDLSEPEAKGGRKLRTYTVDRDVYMPLTLFEQTLAEFYNSLSLAGVSIPSAPKEQFVDLLRGRRR